MKWFSVIVALRPGHTGLSAETSTILGQISHTLMLGIGTSLNCDGRT